MSASLCLFPPKVNLTCSAHTCNPLESVDAWNLFPIAGVINIEDKTSQIEHVLTGAPDYESQVEIYTHTSPEHGCRY